MADPIGPLIEAYRHVHQVAKRCDCGAEWIGNTFLAVRDGEALPRSGRCVTCLEREEITTAKLQEKKTAPPVEAIEVRPPREVGE